MRGRKRQRKKNWKKRGWSFGWMMLKRCRKQRSAPFDSGTRIVGQILWAGTLLIDDPQFRPVVPCDGDSE